MWFSGCCFNWWQRWSAEWVECNLSLFTWHLTNSCSAKQRRGLCGPPTLRVSLCRGHALRQTSERSVWRLRTHYRTTFVAPVRCQRSVLNWKHTSLLLRTRDEHTHLRTSVLTFSWHYRQIFFYITLHCMTDVEMYIQLVLQAATRLCWVTSDWTLLAWCLSCGHGHYNSCMHCVSECVFINWINFVSEVPQNLVPVTLLICHAFWYQICSAPEPWTE